VFRISTVFIEMMRLDNVWGVGGGIKPVKYLVSSGIFLFSCFFTSVLDPYSFDTDPDPAFLAEYRSESRGLMTKNRRRKKFTAGFFF
jgi:hypothetical protein